MIRIGPRAFLERTAQAKGISIEEARAEAYAENPTGRYGTAKEFGAAAAFLCSQYSGFIVGQNLLLDGGALQFDAGIERLISLRDEPIAHTGFGADELRVVGIVFDLGTQLANEDAQILQIVHMRSAPDRGEELTVRDHHARM